ncbi:MAG: OmpA family protein [Deltaproteobacteria bacterium HGW-Deltaproteobacteria-6]|jgi:outer membrane protein OmpA-like peptidoglycan-associated protein|nr:MAG: OmpA family protein [Deltaproteobacteria bacterium HGW-Deltaproteobacteria-6]
MIRNLRTGFAVFAVLLIVMGCSSQKSYVVLMDNADGTIGKLAVSGVKDGATDAKTEVLLATPRTGVDLDGKAGTPYAVDENRIKRDFGDAIAAQPPLPVSFMLYFKAGGTELTAESDALKPAILAAVKSHPAPDVSVIGHTDTMGDGDANEKLGLERAQIVADIIRAEIKKAESIRKDDVHITIASHGERNLLVSTPDNTPEPKNRRVEITVR